MIQTKSYFIQIPQQIRYKAPVEGMLQEKTNPIMSEIMCLLFGKTSSLTSYNKMLPCNIA